MSQYAVIYHGCFGCAAVFWGTFAECQRWIEAQPADYAAACAIA